MLPIQKKKRSESKNLKNIRFQWFLEFKKQKEFELNFFQIMILTNL